MIFQVANITRDVRVALDQNMVSTPLLEAGDVDTLSIEEIIASKIIEAVKRVHCDAPVYLLDTGHNFADTIAWRVGDTYGWTLLPNDFMRLIVFQMKDWERPVYTAIGFDNPLYALQSSRYKGLRGNPQKPVCAIGMRPEGRVLEFYSCKNNDVRVSRALYLPYPIIDEDNGIEICERCYDAVIYAIAALVAATLGDNNKSATLFELAKSALR